MGRFRPCRFIFVSPLLAELALAAACSAANPWQIQMVGGAVLPSDHPVARHTVALVTPVDDTDEVTCSGVLIAPKVILTAAHCVAEASVRIPPTQVFFGDDFSTEEGHLRAIHSTQAHPDFNEFLRRGSFEDIFGTTFKYLPNDVGLVFLAEPAPVGWGPAPILPKESLSLHGRRLGQGPDGLPQMLPASQMLAVGFGTQSPNQLLHLGVRKALTATYAGSDPFNRGTFALFQPSTAQDTCTGDSGGPAYVQEGDTWYLAGTLSYGTFPCDGTWSTYMRTAEYQAWIDNAQAAYVLVP